MLFLTNSDRGQSSVHLATAHALLRDYSDSVEIHFASFPDVAPAVAQAAGQADRKDGVKITFHSVQGTTYKQAIEAKGGTLEAVRHRPGLWGINDFLFLIERAFIPWTAPDYIEVSESIRGIVEDIDIMYAPAVDAVEEIMGSRSHVFLAPNGLSVTLAKVQPQGKTLWRYPA